MINERKIKLLKMLKAEFETGLYEGLCQTSTMMWLDKKITLPQSLILDKIIQSNRPKGKDWDEYYWKIGSIKPRIKWINERIKELKQT